MTSVPIRPARRPRRSAGPGRAREASRPGPATRRGRSAGRRRDGCSSRSPPRRRRERRAPRPDRRRPSRWRRSPRSEVAGSQAGAPGCERDADLVGRSASRAGLRPISTTSSTPVVWARFRACISPIRPVPRTPIRSRGLSTACHRPPRCEPVPVWCRTSSITSKDVDAGRRGSAGDPVSPAAIRRATSAAW